jgi:iron complex transport system substrate-binding protein
MIWRLLSMLLVLLTLPSLSVAVDQGRLPRVLSLNMCADPYLMAFAAPTQILALSPPARDPDMSPFAQQAIGFPISSGGIEDIIALKPDLVIASPYSDHLRLQQIKALNIDIFIMDAAQDFNHARVEILRLGESLGRHDAARAYLAILDQALADIPTLARAPRVLSLHRRGLTIGDGHILTDIIMRAGGIPAVHGNTMQYIGIERAIALRADILLLEDTAALTKSRGAEFLTHPALTAAYAPEKRLILPQALSVCAGAATPQAVQFLNTALQQNHPQ